MKRIHQLLLAAIASTTLGCDSAGADYVKKMEEFAEKSCACKDAACATKLAQEQADWLSKNAQTASKLSAKDAEKIGAATTKMSECVTKIATGG